MRCLYTISSRCASRKSQQILIISDVIKSNIVYFCYFLLITSSFLARVKKNNTFYFSVIIILITRHMFYVWWQYIFTALKPRDLFAVIETVSFYEVIYCYLNLIRDSEKKQHKLMSHMESVNAVRANIGHTLRMHQNIIAHHTFTLTSDVKRKWGRPKETLRRTSERNITQIGVKMQDLKN